jgi:hypothetical protein
VSSNAPARISALKILVGALAIVPLRFSAFAGAVAIPFVLFVCFHGLWFSQSVRNFYLGWPWLTVPFSLLIDLALYTLVAVAVHRIILLGPSAVARYRLEWGTHTTWFLLLVMLLFATTYAVTLTFAQLGRIGWLGAVVAWLLVCGIAVFFVARLLLVFPAAAVGRPISFKESWRLTRHRKLLMILIVVVYPAIIEFPLSWIPTSSLLGYLVSSTLSMLALIVTVVLLSFAYQQIQKEDASAGTTGTHGA